MTIRTDLDPFAHAEITPEERAAVTRLVSSDRDADVILEVLFGELTTPTSRVAPPPPLTFAERERIRWMRSKGMKVQDVAAAIGRSRGTVSLVIREQEA